MGNIAARAGANIGNMLAQQGGTGGIKDWMQVAQMASSTAHQQQENQLTAWKMQGLKELGQIYATNDPDTANKIASSSKWAALIPEQIEKNVAIQNGLREAEHRDYELSKNLAMDTAKMFPFLMTNPTPENFDRLSGMALSGIKNPVVAARVANLQKGMKESLFGGTEDEIDPNKRAAQVAENVRALALYSGMGAQELAYTFGHPAARIQEHEGEVSTIGSPFLGGRRGPMVTGPGGPGTVAAAPDYKPGAVQTQPLPPNIDREPGSPTRTTTMAGEPVPIYTPPQVVDESEAKMSPKTDPGALRPTWGKDGEYTEQVRQAASQFAKETEAVNASRALMNSMDHMEKDLDAAQRSGILAPGWWAEKRLEFVNALNTVLKMTGKEEINPNQVASMQDFIKRATVASFDFDMQHFGASRLAFQTINAGFRAMPSLENSYQGAKLIIDGWREGLRHDLDRRDYQQRFFAQNRNYFGSAEKFEEKFPIQAYADRTREMWGFGPNGYGKDQSRLDWAYETGRLTHPEYMRLSEKILRGQNATRSEPRF